MGPTRILLIEDNPGDVRLVQEALRGGFRGAYTLDHALRLGDGLEHLRRAGADVVLLDLNLPDSHGLATLHQVLAGAQVPVVVLTGVGDDALAVQAVQQGAQDFLVKGAYEGEVLVRALRYAIERHRSLRQLKELEDLRELQRTRAQFINAAAHELSTPLTPILLQLRLLQDDRGGSLSPTQRRCVEVIDRNVARLGLLMQDVLDSSRLQSGRLELRRAPVDVDDVVREAVESFREPARKAGVRLEVDLHGGVVHGDPRRLGQVVLNLLNNAWRFNDKGGTLRVATQRVGTEVVVRVSDTGVGIAEGDLPKLFHPFVQVHPTSGDAPNGTGLGLYICRGIVEVHGGRIWAESAGLGKGSTFAFALPLQPRATDTATQADDRGAASVQGSNEAEPPRDVPIVQGVSPR